MNHLFFAFALFAIFTQTTGISAAAGGLKKVPEDSICVVSIDVDQLKNSKALSQIPWKMLQGSSLNQLGVDLTQLSRVDASVGSVHEEIPPFSIELSSREPMQLEDLKAQELGPVETSRRDESLRFRKFAKTPVLVAQVSPNYSLVGTQKRLIQIWQQTESEHRLVTLADETDAPVRVVVDIDAVRPHLLDGMNGIAKGSPQREGMEELIDKVRNIVTNTQYFKIDLSAETDVVCSLELVPPSGSDSGRLEEDVQWVIGSYLPGLTQKLGPQLEMAMRGSNEAAGGVKPFKVHREGNRVKIEGAAPVASFAIAAGLILPAIQTARNQAMKK